MNVFGRDAEDFLARFGATAFSYDPDTGTFVYLDTAAPEAFGSVSGYRAWLARWPGAIAGSTVTGGYRSVSLCGRHVLAHRFAWFLFHGHWPIVIDHLNGNPADNRIANLRNCDQSTNRMNQRRRSDNRSGVTGVHYNRTKRKWVAQFDVRGRRLQKRFATHAEAVKFRLTHERVLGFGPNHGASE